MAKKRIVVMYGGKADEHSISCISAASALRALDTDKFEAIPVGITKDGNLQGTDPGIDGRLAPCRLVGLPARFTESVLERLYEVG